MSILLETYGLIRQEIGDDLDSLKIERIVVGLFFSGVKLSNGAGGVCFTPVKDIPQAVCCPSSTGRIFDPVHTQGMPVKEILGSLSSSEPVKTAIAIATLTALSATCWENGMRGNYTIQMNQDAQDALPMPVDESVAVVGAFVPVMRSLKRRGGTWWVIEQDPNTLKKDEMAHYVPAGKSEEIIKQADLLFITGVTLVNHTLEGILQAARSEAKIAVIGPTASFLPDVLFDRGVSLVGGVWVKRTNELLDVLAAGGSGYHFFDQLAPRIVIQKQE